MNQRGGTFTDRIKNDSSKFSVSSFGMKSLATLATIEQFTSNRFIRSARHRDLDKTYFLRIHTWKNYSAVLTKRRYKQTGYDRVYETTSSYYFIQLLIDNRGTDLSIQTVII